MIRDKVTITELDILIAIQKQKCLTEMARDFYFSRDTVVVYISRLRNKGFVAYSTHKHNPRYSLTDSGQHLLNDIYASIQ